MNDLAPLRKPRFDWDEARRLHAEGIGPAEIARRLGVTTSGVCRILNPDTLRRAREKSLAVSKHYARKRYYTLCECGRAHFWWTPQSKSSRCRLCRDDALATTVQPDWLLCSTCQEWKRDEDFPLGGTKKARRGRHAVCRACQTIVKRAWREANKVPCIGCGKPCTPPGPQQGVRGSGIARCQRCARHGVGKPRKDTT